MYSSSTSSFTSNSSLNSLNLNNNKTILKQNKAENHYTEEVFFADLSKPVEQNYSKLFQVKKGTIKLDEMSYNRDDTISLEGDQPFEQECLISNGSDNKVLKSSKSKENLLEIKQNTNGFKTGKDCGYNFFKSENIVASIDPTFCKNRIELDIQNKPDIKSKGSLN